MYFLLHLHKILDNQPMKISVIIPVYMVELYVRKCIESILNQENCGAAIECIVVDDCGQDRSMEIVRQMVADYQGTIRFILLKHEQNRGLAAARNTGMDVATGDYILFVDSDDWLPADAILKYVNALQRYPDLDMVIGNYYLRNLEELFYDVNKETLLDNYHARKLLVCNKEGSWSAWGRIVRTEIARKCRFKEGIIHEDQPWTYFLFKEVKRALLIPDNTYFYENIHPTSVCYTVLNKDKVSRHVMSVCYIGNTILDAPYKDLFADTVFFLWHWFFKVFRLQYEQQLGENECRQIRHLRNRIIKSSLKKGRLFLVLFVFTLTSSLFNIRWVRRHYDKLAKTGRSVAFFLEKLHK